MNNFQTIIQPAKIRFKNLGVKEGINIFLNDQEIIRGLNFRQMTQYIPLKSGMYNLKVYASNNNLLLNENLNLKGNKLITFHDNRTKKLTLDIIDEDRQQTNEGSSMIRVVQFSPNLPLINIVENGNNLFSNISYRTISDFIILPQGNYNLQVRLSGTNQVIYQIPNFILLSDEKKTIYLIGLLNSMPQLEALVVKDE